MEKTVVAADLIKKVGIVILGVLELAVFIDDVTYSIYVYFCLIRYVCLGKCF